MKTYIYKGNVNPNDGTSAIDMLDGRVAGIGEEIQLLVREADDLSETVVLVEKNSGEKSQEKSDKAAEKTASVPDNAKIGNKAE